MNGMFGHKIYPQELVSTFLETPYQVQLSTLFAGGLRPPKIYTWLQQCALKIIAMIAILRKLPRLVLKPRQSQVKRKGPIFTWEESRRVIQRISEGPPVCSNSPPCIESLKRIWLYLKCSESASRIQSFRKQSCHPASDPGSSARRWYVGNRGVYQKYRI